LIKLLDIVEKGDVEAWDEEIQKIELEHFYKYDSRDVKEYVDPRYLISMISEIAGDNTVITTEVGQNQIWAANHYNVKKPRAFITSGGLGTMGYGLPAAIGVKIGSPGSKVIAIGGDGSFQMSMQELGTIMQNKLGIKMIVLNNFVLGMVRELQKVGYGGRYSQVNLDANPDFVKIADAYGFKGNRISRNSEVADALEKMLADEEPYLLECIVDPEEPTL